MPEHPRAYPESLRAIERADLILIGPGSLYTSIIPNFLVSGVTEAVERSKAYKLMIMNLMTQDGETEGYTAADHVRELTRHSGNVVDACLANLCPVPEHLREEYNREGAGEIVLDWEEIEKLGVKLFTAPLLSDSSEYARHDPDLLAKAILELWRKEGRRTVNSRR